MRETRNPNNILPARLKQILDDFYREEVKEIYILGGYSFSSPMVKSSLGKVIKIEPEEGTRIYKYFAKAVGITIDSDNEITSNGEFKINVSEGTCKCNFSISVIRKDGSIDPIYFLIKIRILEMEEKSIASLSRLDQLMELTNHQDFETAIKCISAYLKESISQLQTCQKRINYANNKQIQLEAEVESAISKAQQASDSSRDAWRESADLFHRKDAIAALQRAGFKMGEALVKSTDIHLHIIESQNALLEAQAQQLYYQKLLMDISKGILVLGANNQCTIDALYSELATLLTKVGEEEIGELAMRELQSVAAQLKERQEILTRIVALEEKVAFLMSKS